ncbi:MAG: tRNA uridine-5-carboxymethylaminomethyl(34) synthesis GTPase MnmE [Actinomycetota bacterium]|nr:tRNA uridine-5-carboxymethylaminomethyl(34) synthesis GTPase MnmE [Actinomycetota bacterium]
MEAEINDTIVAVGTRAGEAAIGIVKLSGSRSIFIADKIFKSKNKKKIKDINTYSMIYGHIVDNEGHLIDEVIVTVMKNPGSYTREDVVEINCHGGIIATTKTMELCIENGARIADPGEFTKRAFLNGRIDLSQAEAVIDLVRSRTEQSLRLAAKNLRGNIKEEINRLRKNLFDIRVKLEARVDFIEEDLEVTPYQEITKEIIKIRAELEELIMNEKKGEIIKNGVKIAIIGKPNVGKSSLLNLLSRKEKAIVTPIPGTTRDAVEEILYVEGIPLILIDTAGIRKTRSTIEKIGVDKSLKHIDEAELILLVLDGNRKLEQIDLQIINKIKGKSIICCINKIDLKQKLEVERIRNYFSEKYIIKISALKGKGIKKLENKIKYVILGKGDIDLEEKIIINSRHKEKLEEVKKSLNRAVEAVENKMSEEFPSYDLKTAFELLGEIIGETAREDILEKIFSQFCIGK